MAGSGMAAVIRARAADRSTAVLVSGISPAEPSGCLRPERIAGCRGVAVQCMLPGVVRCLPQAGRPRDLLLRGGKQAPPDVLAGRQERRGALGRRQRGRPGTGEHPARRSCQRCLRCHARLSQSCTAHTCWPCHRRFCASKSAWGERPGARKPAPGQLACVATHAGGFATQLIQAPGRQPVRQIVQRHNQDRAIGATRMHRPASQAVQNWGICA
jgi:hypothetical protein